VCVVISLRAEGQGLLSSVPHRGTAVFLFKLSRPAVRDPGHFPSKTATCLLLVKGRKVKCTLVQVLRLCTGRRAHTGSRGIALPFLDHGTRRG